MHNICDGICDCINEDGYNNLGDWNKHAAILLKLAINRLENY